MFKRILREYVVPAVLLTIKILTALRTGIDTFLVSRDVLNVLLLDGVFLAMWLVLAYGGDSQQMKRFKPFGLMGTWAMFAVMLWIGWEAHAGHPAVALAVRMAGAIALALDTWDYVSEHFVAWFKSTYAAWKVERNRQLDVTAYTRVLIQKRMKASVDLAGKKLRGHIDVGVLEYIRNNISNLMVGMLEPAVDSETYKTPEPDIIIEKPQDKSGDQQSSIERPSNVHRTSTIERWKTVSPMLPATFKRSDVEEKGNCKKSTAVELISYAKDVGYISEVSRGVYEYMVTTVKELVEGELVE